MTAGYRFIFGDLRTGKQYRVVDLVNASWSLPLGEPGVIEGSYPLGAIDPKSPAVVEALGGDLRPRPMWPTAHSDATVGKSYLVVAYVNAAGDETLLEGGPVWKLDADHKTKVLKVGAAGLGSYFDHRKVMKVLAAGEDPADPDPPPTYRAGQLGLIAKNLVELSQSHMGGHLPIVLPSDASLGGLVPEGVEARYEETYPGYELAWVGDKLKALSERDGGPEIQFVPRRRTDDPRYIEWVMRIGTADTKMMLTQFGKPWSWDTSVPRSDVRGISISADGTRMAFRQWAAGQGQAEGRPIAYNTAPELLDAGFPLLEGEVTAVDSEAEGSTLNEYVDQALAFSQRPIETWSATVSRDGRPTVGQLRPGDWAKFVLRDHFFKPDGEYAMRILSMSGGDSETITLNLAERLGEF